jgi:hypothetical protein
MAAHHFEFNPARLVPPGGQLDIRSDALDPMFISVVEEIISQNWKMA